MQKQMCFTSTLGKSQFQRIVTCEMTVLFSTTETTFWWE